MAYVDFNYYSNTFRGTDIKDENEFIKAEKKASLLVNLLTKHRVSVMKEIPDEVKDAVCAAAEIYGSEYGKVHAGVKSENTDGYSVTYTDAVAEDSAADKKAAEEIRKYLRFTGLLYRGYGQIDRLLRRERGARNADRE